MIRFNISNILTVLTIGACFQCENNRRIEDIKECLKREVAEICIKMHKGL